MKTPLDNHQLHLWIDNDEGLYTWWKSSKKSKTAFIQENRQELVEVISRAINQPPRAFNSVSYCY
jgi:hypothetical protein